MARKEGHRVLVIGDMAELGDKSASFHQAAGRYARERGIHQLLATGVHSAIAAEEFGPGADHYQTCDELSEALSNLLAPNVCVLIKGSRGARMERVVESLLYEK